MEWNGYRNGSRHRKFVRSGSFCLMSSDAKSILGTIQKVVIDRFYIALFSAFEQTHCTGSAGCEPVWPSGKITAGEGKKHLGSIPFRLSSLFKSGGLQTVL